MVKLINLIGKKFGRLTVIKRVENTKNNKTQWLCKCDCGNYIKVQSYLLTHNYTKSCGCIAIEKLKKRSITHGLSKSKIYAVYCTIKARCNNPNNNVYQYYGAKGVKLCSEWLNFENFYNWAINNGYKEGLSIDRINVNGDYEPSNCRWATKEEQSNNRSNNHLITYNNQIHTISEWSKITGLTKSAIQYRLSKKWDIEKIFTTPLRRF